MNAVDDAIRTEIEKLDCGMALLTRLQRDFDLRLLAEQWLALRAAQNMDSVRPFDGSDGSAVSAHFALESMLHLTKLRLEIEGVMLSNEGNVDLSIASSHVTHADIALRAAVNHLLQAHFAIFGVGLVPK